MKIQLQAVSDPCKRIWTSSDLPVDETWFDIGGMTYDEQNHAGRAAVIKITQNNQSMILRHYYRGGIPARFSKDRFLFLGWQATRAYREIHLLQEMRRLGLPVPQPIAARSTLSGMFYTCDILMQEIENTQTLAQVLANKSLSASLWSAIGSMIKAFHLQGFEHVDLNAGNILLDREEKIFLIDFDRCKKRTYHHRWSLKGIQRLHRSLGKFKQQEKLFYFDQCDFSALLKGYDA